MSEAPSRTLDFDDFDEVLKEEDPFRLVIRGHAAIEDTMDAAIAEAFRGNIPGELKGGFRSEPVLRSLAP